MAYDPEARQSGNSAMIISIVALVVIVGAILAWYASRPAEVAVVPGSTTIVERDRPVPVNNTVVVESAPNTVVVEKPVPGTDRTIVRDTKTTTTNNVVTTPRSGGSSGGSAAPNVTTNVTVTPPTSSSGSSGGSGASDSTSSDGGNSAAPSDSATGNADLPPPAP